MKHLIVVAAAFVVASPVYAASSAPQGQAATEVKVRRADLNLSNPRDAAVMLRRLDRAAAKACGASDASLREHKRAVRESACYQGALDQAVASTGSSTVLALHRAPSETMAFTD